MLLLLLLLLLQGSKQCCCGQMEQSAFSSSCRPLLFHLPAVIQVSPPALPRARAPPVVMMILREISVNPLNFDDKPSFLNFVPLPSPPYHNQQALIPPPLQLPRVPVTPLVNCSPLRSFSCCVVFPTRARACRLVTDARLPPVGYKQS